MLPCYLTLPTENKRILGLNTVNNGIYVQAGVGRL